MEGNCQDCATKKELREKLEDGTMGICDVCAVDGIGELKVVVYCEKCDARICEKCMNKWFKRGFAAIKKLIQSAWQS